MHEERRTTTSMGEKRTAFAEICSENLMERDNLVDLGVDINVG